MRLRIEERQAHRALIIIQAVVCVVFAAAAPILGLSSAMLIAALVALGVYVGLWFAYERGFAWAAPAIVASTTLIVGVSIVLDSSSSVEFSPVFFVPLVFALIYSGAVGTLLTGAFMLGLMLIALPAPNPYGQPLRIVLVVLITLGLALARSVLDTMRERAQDEAARAQEARVLAEREAATAQARAEELEARSEEQRQLLDLVADLETPAITLSEGVLLAPLVGALDSRRMERLITRLLESVSVNRAQLVVLDVAGVRVIDTQVAGALAKLVACIRLLGCNVVITSISAEVAVTLTQLGVAFNSIATARSPGDALSNHLATVTAQHRQN